MSPIISLAVVIKGPVAKAGSIFILFKIKGVKAPNTAAPIIIKKREKETV